VIKGSASLIQTKVAENGITTAVNAYDSNGNRINGFNKAGGILAYTMHRIASPHGML